MLFRFSMIFLIMGFYFTAHQMMPLSHSPALRMPQSLQTLPESTYNFVTGTDGCPLQVDLADDCGGFTITPLKGSGQIYDEQKFCNINKEATIKTEHVDRGIRRTRTDVRQEENLIKKKSMILFSYKGNSISLLEEDTIILDDAGKFLWERQRNGRGSSCLYAK